LSREVAFLDLSKAFDRVPRQTLMKALTRRCKMKEEIEIDNLLKELLLRQHVQVGPITRETHFCLP